MKMPWGKYGPKKFPPKGVDIAFINSSYLKWLIDEEGIFMKPENEPLVVAVEAELKYRDQNNCHFYKDKVGGAK